jgi:hypothetical protein
VYLFALVASLVWWLRLDLWRNGPCGGCLKARRNWFVVAGKTWGGEYAFGGKSAVFNQGLSFSVPVLIMALCTVALGGLCVAMAWVEVIHERVGNASWRIPNALHALTAAVFLDAIELDSGWSSPGDLLHVSDYVCVLLVVVSFVFVVISVVLGAKGSDPGTRIVKTVSKALVVIDAFCLMLMIAGLLAIG